MLVANYRSQSTFHFVTYDFCRAITAPEALAEVEGSEPGPMTLTPDLSAAMAHDLFALGCTLIESMYAPVTDIVTADIDTWKVRLAPWLDDAGVAHPPRPCFRSLPGVVALGGTHAPMDTQGQYWAFQGRPNSVEHLLWTMTRFPVGDRVSDVGALLDMAAAVDSGDLVAMLHRKERAEVVMAREAQELGHSQARKKPSPPS